MYFGHTRKRAIIITASDYNELRKIEGKHKYADLPETLNDQSVIEAGIKRLGFEEEETLTLSEPSWAELHKVIMELALDLQKASMQGERTWVFTYYAGHGLSDNNLYAQLNEERLYPIEKMLRSLAKADGSYVIALFDCCRERIMPGTTRGTGADETGMLDV